MKEKDVLLIGGLLLGAYFVYKSGLLDRFLGGQGGFYGGGGGSGEGGEPDTPIIEPPPIIQQGDTIMQQPSGNNRVITAPNVRSGQVIVVPQTTVGSQFTKAPYAPQPTPPPLDIRNVFGFPIVPALQPVEPIVQPVPDAPPTVYQEPSDRYHMGR